PPEPAQAPAPAPAPAKKTSRKEPEEKSVVTEVLTSKPMQSFLRSAASAAGREFSRAIFGTGRKRRR
ncbi:MAG: ATPase, partial [Gordonia amarae]